MFFVYVLRNAHGRLYVGHTGDLERRLARVVHQEKGDVLAAAHLLALNEAYEHLGDGRKRAAYNDQLGIPQEEEPPRRQGWLKRLWSH